MSDRLRFPSSKRKKTKMETEQEDPLKKKTSSIRKLPNEILLTVFSYLSTHDVKYNVSNVCVQWSNLSKDKQLWRHLKFSTRNKMTKTFGRDSWYSTLRFLETTPELQNVTVSQGHTEDELVEILESLNDHCHSLRHIEFEADVSVATNRVRGLNAIFESVESLKVKLDSCHSQKAVFKMVSNFKNLKRISFSGANPESWGFRNLLRGSPLLEWVNVAGVDLSKKNFSSLWRTKEKFIGLEMKIDKLDEGCVKLLEMFPKLKYLMLSDGNASPKKLSGVGNLRCLNKLHLQEEASSPVLTSSALIDFFQNGSFISLRELKLHKSRLNDEGAAEIRQKCLNLNYLEVMTYPRSLSSLTEKALLHFLHCHRLKRFEILFDNSQEADWIYRRIRYVPHDCDIDRTCPVGLEKLLDSWDEVKMVVD